MSALRQDSSTCCTFGDRERFLVASALGVLLLLLGLGGAISYAFSEHRIILETRDVHLVFYRLGKGQTSSYATFVIFSFFLYGGFAALLLAGFAAFIREGITFDKESGKVTVWNRWLFGCSRQEYPLAIFKAVTLSSYTRPQSHGLIMVTDYAVALTGAAGDKLTIRESCLKLETARELAQELSTFLGLEIRNQIETYDFAEGLEPSVVARLRGLMEKAETCQRVGRYHGTLAELSEAMVVLTEQPGPVFDYPATTRILTARGDAYFRMGKFDQALKTFQTVLKCPGGTNDAFVQLRLGQSLFELGDIENARLKLARALSATGQERFAGEDPKYLALVTPDQTPRREDIT